MLIKFGEAGFLLERIDKEIKRKRNADKKNSALLCDDVQRGKYLCVDFVEIQKAVQKRN